MDESALKALLISLEGSRSTLHWWLEFWTFLVVVGVALEVIFVVWEYAEELHDFSRGTVHPPERPSRLLFFLGLLGAALVAIGVAGELYSESKIETAETGIRKANDELFSLLSKEASDALERASANDLAAQQLKAENLRLEAIIAPRSLSLEQQRQIADVCRKFQGHGVLVKSYGMDGEAAMLAGQIIAALKSVPNIGVADGRGSSTVSGGFDIGVHVRGPETEHEFASVLGDALSRIGKLKVLINDPEPRMGAMMGGGGQGFPAGTSFVTIMVGVKPLPVLPAAQ